MKKIHIGIVFDQFANLFRGGAEEQVDNTINFLNKIENIHVEFIDYRTTNIKQFDIIHFFKSYAASAYYPVVRAVINKKIPYVVSTIIFSEHYCRDILKYRLFHHAPLINKIPLLKFQYYLWDNAKILFPNTDAEALFLSRIGVKTPSLIVPNGLNIEIMENLGNEQLFLSNYPFLRDKKFVLNVGRIESRKNQKRLVKACMHLNLPIVIIGKIYDEQLFDEITSLNYKELYYLGPIYDKNILFGAYKACSVFCLPSTMETPGIAAMEASYFNKPIVITKSGGTQYYFKDSAYYVNWKDIKDIAKGIKTMFEGGSINTKDLMKQYSWDNIAQQYVEEYHKILERK